MEYPTIYYAPPIYRSVEARHMQCLVDLAFTASTLGARVMFEPVVGVPMLSRARSQAATTFLRTGNEVLLMIDQDILFDSVDALELCRKAVQFGVIAGIYATKTKNPKIPVSLLPGTSLKFPRMSPLDVERAPSGFIAIHRSVINKLKDKIPEIGGLKPYFMERIVGDYPSEDFSFCDLVREHGMRVWIDPSIHLRHLGEYEFVIPDGFEVKS